MCQSENRQSHKGRIKGSAAASLLVKHEKTAEVHFKKLDWCRSFLPRVGLCFYPNELEHAKQTCQLTSDVMLIRLIRNLRQQVTSSSHFVT